MGRGFGLILIDRRDWVFHYQSTYILSIEGTLLVKRTKRHLNGWLEIISDNDGYGTDRVTSVDLQTWGLNVIGRVVWNARNT